MTIAQTQNKVDTRKWYKKWFDTATKPFLYVKNLLSKSVSAVSNYLASNPILTCSVFATVFILSEVIPQLKIAVTIFKFIFAFSAVWQNNTDSLLTPSLKFVGNVITDSSNFMNHFNSYMNDVNEINKNESRKEFIYFILRFILSFALIISGCIIDKSIKEIISIVFFAIIFFYIIPESLAVESLLMIICITRGIAPIILIYKINNFSIYDLSVLFLSIFLTILDSQYILYKSNLYKNSKLLLEVFKGLILYPLIFYYNIIGVGTGMKQIGLILFILNLQDIQQSTCMVQEFINYCEQPSDGICIEQVKNFLTPIIPYIKGNLCPRKNIIIFFIVLRLTLVLLICSKYMLDFNKDLTMTSYSLVYVLSFYILSISNSLALVLDDIILLNKIIINFESFMSNKLEIVQYCFTRKIEY